MGKRPEERMLRNQAAEVLARLRKRDGRPKLSRSEVRRVAAQVGLSDHNIEELLEAEEEE